MCDAEKDWHKHCFRASGAINGCQKSPPQTGNDIFFPYFKATSNVFLKTSGIFVPELNTILSVGTWLEYFRRKLLKLERIRRVECRNVPFIMISCAPLLMLRVLHITPVQNLYMLKIDSFYPT